MSTAKASIRPKPSAPAVKFPEIVSALTFALDLTEGAVPGHALRCCLLGMRLAQALPLADELMQPLYYALQLKDVGCSSNSARLAQMVGGDERSVKYASKLADLTGGLRSAGRTISNMWRHVLPEERWRRRALRLVSLGIHRQSNTQQMTQLRCERGSNIVRKLDLGDLAATAVYGLDEHWDGSGHPDHLVGDEIPVLARICMVAQHLDCFAMAHGPETAIKTLSKRSGSWFDPAIVAVVKALHADGSLWEHCRPECPVEVTRKAVLELEPDKSESISEAQIDNICEAFADVVDAKSPFTYRHSLGVAEVAGEIAAELGISAERRQLVRRAALLHDLGKLGVPNTILDKTTSLTAKEFCLVREHPFLTRTILERISSFEELAIIAGEHHERLDGTGYPLGVAAAELRLESRIIAVADVFTALAEERPYRKACEIADALQLLESDVPRKLDATCYTALRAAAVKWDGVKPAVLTRPFSGEVCEIRRPKSSGYSKVMKAVS